MVDLADRRSVITDEVRHSRRLGCSTSTLRYPPALPSTVHPIGTVRSPARVLTVRFARVRGERDRYCELGDLPAEAGKKQGDVQSKSTNKLGAPRTGNREWAPSDSGKG